MDIRKELLGDKNFRFKEEIYSINIILRLLIYFYYLNFYLISQNLTFEQLLQKKINNGNDDVLIVKFFSILFI